MDRRIEKKRFTPRRIALGGLAAAVIAFGAYALLSVNPSSLNVDAEKLTLAPVTYGPFLEYIVEQGAVMPLTTIYLDAVEGGTRGGGLCRAGHPRRGRYAHRAAFQRQPAAQRHAARSRAVPRGVPAQGDAGDDGAAAPEHARRTGGDRILAAPGRAGICSPGRDVQGGPYLAAGLRRGEGQPGIPDPQAGRDRRDAAPGFAFPDDPDPATGGIDRPAAPEPGTHQAERGEPDDPRADHGAALLAHRRGGRVQARRRPAGADRRGGRVQGACGHRRALHRPHPVRAGRFLRFRGRHLRPGDQPGVSRGDRRAVRGGHGVPGRDAGRPPPRPDAAGPDRAGRAGRRHAGASGRVLPEDGRALDLRAG